MKKHKILIVALAMAVMCTGAGYAYWSQTLTIDNTVNTGNLEVGFICPTDTDDWDDGFTSGSHSDLVTVSAITTGQNIKFTVNNFYPGAGASLDFAIKNKGTVPAKVSKVTGDITHNTALCNVLDYEFNKVGIKHLGSFSYYDITPISADNVTDLASGLTGVLDDYTLQPGDTLILLNHAPSAGFGPGYPGYNILMPGEEIINDQFEKQTASFTMNLEFTQQN